MRLESSVRFFAIPHEVRPEPSTEFAKPREQFRGARFSLHDQRAVVAYADVDLVARDDTDRVDSVLRKTDRETLAPPEDSHHDLLGTIVVEQNADRRDVQVRAGAVA